MNGVYINMVLQIEFDVATPEPNHIYSQQAKYCTTYTVPFFACTLHPIITEEYVNDVYVFCIYQLLL